MEMKLWDIAGNVASGGGNVAALLKLPAMLPLAEAMLPQFLRILKDSKELAM